MVLFSSLNVFFITPHFWTGINFRLISDLFSFIMPVFKEK